MRALSLSGVPLDGQCLVRRIYCDESGTSGKTFFVVAGVIVHGETQWKPLEERIASLIEKYVLPEDRFGFHFRATELFSGSGRFKNPEKYPLARRCEAFRELLSIPSEFRLPVVFGFTRIEVAIPSQSTQARRKAIAENHALTFCRCAIAAEKFMREHTEPKELAELILEDNTETKKSVDLMGNILRSRSGNPIIVDFQRRESERLQLNSDFLPLTKISESISWKKKGGARLLQIADACAFIIRTFLEERADVEQFVRAFVPPGPERIADISKIRQHAAGMLEVKSWD